MYYCFDSYLGLGYDFTDDNLYANEHPVNWRVTGTSNPIVNGIINYHQLQVNYGQLITINPPGPYDD
jgi:hypothetical protein